MESPYHQRKCLICSEVEVDGKILDSLITLINDKLNVEYNEAITGYTHISDIPTQVMDSLDKIDLLLEIEETFGIDIPDEVGALIDTPTRMAQYISRCMHNTPI